MFAEKLGLEYGLLSDYNWEAARAFDLYYERGVDLSERVGEYSPLNTRGAFLVETDGTVRYAYKAPEIGQLPDPQALLDAV